MISVPGELSQPLLFLFIMLIGGCSGSSSCGLKIFRIQILIKSSLNLIKKLFNLEEFLFLPIILRKLMKIF